MIRLKTDSCEGTWLGLFLLADGAGAVEGRPRRRQPAAAGAAHHRPPHVRRVGDAAQAGARGRRAARRSDTPVLRRKPINGPEIPRA